MRTITDHKLNGLNDAITINVLDEPGQGGACQEYEIEIDRGPDKGPLSTRISFQNGPVEEVGFNGLSQEALLAIVIDRLNSFQQGQYACRENDAAMECIQTGLMWLQKRTRDQLARGVEGTNVK